MDRGSNVRDVRAANRHAPALYVPYVAEADARGASTTSRCGSKAPLNDRSRQLVYTTAVSPGFLAVVLQSGSEWPGNVSLSFRLC